jgi:hypothetical protein
MRGTQDPVPKGYMGSNPIPCTNGSKKKRLSVFRHLTKVAYVTALGVVFLASFYLIQNYVQYDKGNFQCLLGALSQSLVTIFAIVASGTFLLVQIVEQRSPRAMDALPRRIVFLFFGIYVLIISFDWVSILLLPSTADHVSLAILTTLLLANIIGILIVLPYADIMMSWMRPERVIRSLIDKVKKNKDIEIRRNAIHSLEEIGVQIAERRQLQTARILLNAYEEIGVLLAREDGESYKLAMKDPYRPLRLLPKSLGRIGVNFSNYGLEDVIHIIAWKFGTLAEEYLKNHVNVDVEFSMSIVKIIRASANNGLQSAIYNFSANMGYVIESFIKQHLKGTLKAHRYRGPAYMFGREIIEIGKICLSRGYYDLCNRIAEEIKHISLAYSKYGTDEDFAILDLMDTIQEFRKLCSEANILENRGFFEGEMIKKLLADSEASLRKSFPQWVT